MTETRSAVALKSDGAYSLDPRQVRSEPKPGRTGMEKYLSPEEVCELIPGMTTNLLAQMRF
jgi:hypothetical protein